MLVNGYRLADQIKVTTALLSFLREREPVVVQITAWSARFA
jgi:hypothetical protein